MMSGMGGLTAQQRYLFDLRGFLILRNIIPTEEVAEARQAISANLHKFHERKGDLRNSRREAFQGDHVKGRLDCGTMLSWDKPHCEVFRRFLVIPQVIPIINELCGKGYRLDHLPLTIIQYKNAEGFDLHGGNVDESGQWMTDLSYDCRYGKISCNLLNVAVPLDKVEPGDGGFVIIPGSHKANFPIPPEIADCDKLDENKYLVNPHLNPGDVLLFTEAATHGAFPWKGSSESRRTVFYRFCPPNFGYGRGYVDKREELAKDVTEQQRVVLQPPFTGRLNRYHLEDDGTIGCTVRSKEKLDYDRAVFDSEYF